MRLDWYLEKNGIAVEQFAAEIGVHRTSVYRFMKGLAFPRPSTIERITAATHGKVNANDFIGLAKGGRSRKLAAVG
jgi:transcriptional regulator with XRE-family HTH domain